MQKTKSVLLISVLGLAVAALSLVIFNKIQSYRKFKAETERVEQLAKQEKELAQLKTFGLFENLPDVNIKTAELKTKFIEENISYQFTLTQGEKKISLPNTFTIELEDNGGFVVGAFRIESSQLIQGLDSSGNIGSYYCKGRVPFSIDKYSLVSMWKISWSK